MNWISIKDKTKLPTEITLCWVCNVNYVRDDQSYNPCWMARYDPLNPGMFKEFNVNAYYPMPIEITHWIPLPQPPNPISSERVKDK